MLNNQNIDILLTGAVNDAQRQALIINFETLANTPSEHFLMALVERIAAVAIHLSLSVLVWFAAKGGKAYCYILWQFCCILLLMQFP